MKGFSVLLLAMSTSFSFGQKVDFKKYFYPFEEFGEMGRTYTYQDIKNEDTTYHYEYMRYYPKERKFLHEISFPSLNIKTIVTLSVDRKGIKVDSIKSIDFHDHDTTRNITDGAYFAYWKMSAYDTLSYAHLYDDKSKTPCFIALNEKRTNYSFNNKEYKCVSLDVTSLKVSDSNTINEKLTINYAEGIGAIYLNSQAFFKSEDEEYVDRVQMRLIAIKEGGDFETVK